MVEDSGLKALITRRGLIEGLTHAGVRVVLFDEPLPTEASDGDNAAEPYKVTADNLAYVIYTSGSTGQPRGVALTHGGLSNLVAAQRRAFGVRTDERVLQFAAFSFDASVSEFFVTLLAGATLVLSDAESLLPGPSLTEFLRSRSVTMATLPPSALSNMERAEAGVLTKLVTAGEPLTPGALGRWGATAAGSSTPTARRRRPSAPPSACATPRTRPSPSAARLTAPKFTSSAKTCNPSPRA